jgi:hypothetical protein
VVEQEELNPVYGYKQEDFYMSKGTLISISALIGRKDYVFDITRCYHALPC